MEFFWKGLDYSYEAADIIRLYFNSIKITGLNEEDDFFSMGNLSDFLYMNVVKNESDKIYLYINYNQKDKIEEYIEETEQRIIKNHIKRILIDLFKKHTGYRPPWGTVTGVKPGKIINSLLDKGLSEDKIYKKMKTEYYLPEKKTKLLLDAAKVQRPLFAKNTPGSVGIYVSIPFCRTRCNYCTFLSGEASKLQKLIKPYTDVLLYEISETFDYLKNNGFTVKSIYVGGGTPVAIDNENLERILNGLEKNFTSDVDEFCVEAGRPDCINTDNLKILRKYDISRICINPQTMNHNTLSLIGRMHTGEDTERAFYLSREMGFDNINMDIIAGLPGEDLNDFLYTLERLHVMSPDSFTVHSLAVKRGSKLKENIDFYHLPSDLAEKMHEAAQSLAMDMGMSAYYLYKQKFSSGNLENTGFCKPGNECIYNINIMEEKQTIIGLGANAVSKFYFSAENRIERVYNPKDIICYIDRIRQNAVSEKKLKYLEEVL